LITLEKLKGYENTQKINPLTEVTKEDGGENSVSKEFE
jgi:hypothetical protein